MPTNMVNHITQTYVNLRIGMAILAFSLPLLLMAGSWLSANVVFQGSISAFYHTAMRNLFVGLLVAVGSFLYLYKGFSKKENIALNVAGLSAIGVAFFPTIIPKNILEAPRSYLPIEPFTAPYLHGFCAVVLFFAIAYVCVFCGNETIALIENKKTRERYEKIYKGLGLLMVVFPILAVLFSFVAARDYLIFIVEFVAIWIFALFWLTKVMELRHHKLSPEQKIISTVEGNSNTKDDAVDQ